MLGGRSGGFNFSINVVSVLPESHNSVVGHSKCGEGVRVGKGCVVECNFGLFRVFLVPWCDEC